ncbi:MAG: cupredoxin family copper-binding protein [Beijerinckiaceae bacterium]
MLTTRRGFGRGLCAALALANLPGQLNASDGPREVEVGIARFNFGPSRIEIFVGDSVTWINADFAPHTATADDGAWDTGALERHARGRITFNAPGTYHYFCVFHPHMKGTVVVRPISG